ncbi:hypothetical protein EX30DRAFT_344213 [Ascodesmis nigricans]|uniref:DUF4238 domain-containing protein n=1 Tax=Ascodesmis nigricans TaxID=341454 RepID=A0A4S2MKE9_9PEZI|nr:hypothetical protein EX30DRAFT_344213 [Ascodesmis nigricans]
MATSSTPSRNQQCSPRSQYHHYIPRFILRNYAKEKDQPLLPPRRRNRRKSRATSDPTTPHLQNDKDRILNTVNLSKGAIEQVTVSKAFGMLDMYRDFDPDNADQNRIERKLSELENRVAKTLAAVKRDFINGEKEATISRTYLYDLRKFLFIMLYRSKMFYERFNVSMEEYSANDKDELLPYMREKGIKKPKDVWLANIEAFLDVKIDHGQEWLMTVVEKAYPPDAMWFYKNVTMFFLSFCTPDNPEEEFLLTENVYGIFEGANDGPGGKWTDYHLFAPISPDLIIVCRSNVLPSCGPKSGNEKELQAMRAMLESQHTYRMGETLLEHLPVSKARNDYSKVVNGRLVPLPHYNTRRPEDDKFFFSFNRLPTKYVQRINSVMLEQAKPTEMILYRSEEALRVALVAYLELDFPGFKMATQDLEEEYNPYIGISLNQFQFLMLKGDTFRSDELYLAKVIKISRALGDKPKVKYTIKGLEFSFGGGLGLANQMTDDPTPISSEENSNFIALYKGLGGKLSCLRRDLLQVRLITRMHSLILGQRHAPGVSPASYEDIFRCYRDFMVDNIPTRILWLYYKSFLMKSQISWQSSHLLGHMVSLSRYGAIPFQFSGPEDGLARTHYLFNDKSLRRLIYHASYTELYRSQHPTDARDTSKNMASGFSDIPMHLAQEFRCSITDCGIAPLETVALGWKEALNNPHYDAAAELPESEAFLRFLLNPARLAEVTVRWETEKAFEKVMRHEGKWDDLVMDDLRFVLFVMLYRSGIGGLGGTFLESRPMWRDRHRYRGNLHSQRPHEVLSVLCERPDNNLQHSDQAPKREGGKVKGGKKKGRKGKGGKGKR